ncbi:MAG: hypothetical protein OEY85_13545, partial [Rhodospirillales bacterium]|nr:hypothetical protein [Rhodospirillales bacterium]
MTATILRTDAELGIIEQYLDRLRDVAVVTTTEHYDEPGLIQAAAGADLILTCYTEITAAVMNAAPNLKGIVKYGVGVNNIDLATATRNGVMVANCPAYGSDTVADHAFALLIALARKIPAIDRIMRKQAWAWPEPGLLGFDLAGKTLGLIGMGRIGRAMARRGQGFGMKVITVDPYVTADDIRPLEVEFTTLDELLDRSDFVSIHCILTPETRGLLDARRLSRMKPTAFLIDVSRGAIVDEDALIR